MSMERTYLTPQEEAEFQVWVQTNRQAPGVGNHDAPDAKYDMRGFWKDKKALAQWKPGEHFPDTYKQHGHPTFSQESQYSSGASDGGMWLGETFLEQPRMAPSHMTLEQLMLQRARK